MESKRSLMMNAKSDNADWYPHTSFRITEQPAPASLRFRYYSEGRTAGSILGKNSTENLKTFPTVQMVNFSGTAHITAFCVTADEPHQ